MSLNVTGGNGLEFTATLDADSFDKGINKINDDLKKVTDKAASSGNEFNKNFAGKLESSMNSISKSSAIGKNAIGGLADSLTSLINPTSIITAGLSAAAIAIYKYYINTSQAAKQQKILSDIIEAAGKNYGQTAGKIDVLKDKLNDLSVPLKDRISYAKQYNDIADQANRIDIQQLNNLNAINPLIEAQIKLFKDRAIARAAETVVAQKAEVVFKAQLEFDTKFPEFSTQTVSNLVKTATDAVDQAKKELGVNGKLDVNELLNFADLPDSQLQQLAEKNSKFKLLLDDRTKNILFNVHKQLQAIDEYKNGTKAGGGGAAALQAIINQGQQDLNAALDVASGLINPTEPTKDPKKDPANMILEERKRLIADIISLQRKSEQSGLTKQASELDVINQGYDNLISKITEFNKKVPKSLQIDTSSLQAARENQLQNTTYKQNAKDYISSLQVQQKAFEDFENAKLKLGEQKAKELYAAQIQGANSYLEYLQNQKKKIEDAVTNQGGKPNIQQTVELDTLNKKIQDETEKRNRDQVIQQVENYQKLLKEVVTYDEAKLAINKKYDDLEKTARNDKAATEQETKERLAIIEEMRKADLADLQNNLLKQSDLFKKLGEDMTFFTKEQLKKRAADLEQTLLNNTSLTPVMKEAVQGLIDQINKLLHVSTPAEKFNAVANGLNDISQALSSTDANLSKMIGTLGSLAGAVGSTLSDLKTLKSSTASSADQIGAVGGIFGAFFSVVGIINGFINSAAQKRQQLQEQEANTLVTVEQGEVAINDQYRQRLLLQSKINDSRLSGLKAEADALNSNLQTAQDDFNKILKDIQSQGKVAIPEGWTAEQIAVAQHSIGIGFGPYIQEFQQATSLAGKSFEELNKLSLEGRLDDRAKQLFQTLQSLNDEITTIKTNQADLDQKTAEQITGTTADSITQSIISGFENGNKAVSDFADNFQSLMQQAILNSLSDQYLKTQLANFYDQFAAAAKSDGVLTKSEITDLQASYNEIIKNAQTQFEELQKATGVNFSGSSSTGNSLQGGIKGITESTAEIIAGQFGGLRITAISQLNIAMSSLSVLNKIEYNTALIAETNRYLKLFYTQGLKIL